MEKIFCQKCKKDIIDKPRKNLMGFQIYKCKECNIEYTYPLSKTYRRIYQIIIYFFIALIILNIIFGKSFGLPGIFTIIAGIGLYYDSKIREKLK